MATRKKARGARAPKKRADQPVPLARTLESVRSTGAPASDDLARATVVDAALCLADPARKAEHRDAAGALSEAVSLLGIAAARELVSMHEGDSAWHPEVHKGGAR